MTLFGYSEGAPHRTTAYGATKEAESLRALESAFPVQSYEESLHPLVVQRQGVPQLFNRCQVGLPPSPLPILTAKPVRPLPVTAEQSGTALPGTALPDLCEEGFGGTRQATAAPVHLRVCSIHQH